MLRSTTLSTAALLCAALLTPAAVAYAAGETCQGRPATIVGSDRDIPLEGTDGPDVIVSTGARVIDARGGDDLICVVDTSVRLLDAGPGDDVVDVSAGHDIKAVLGAGADTYLGSAGHDQVWTGTRARDWSVEEDTETDVIDTGDAQSSDEVHSGERGVPNADQVRVGVMAAVSWGGTPTATSVLSSIRYSSLTLDLDARDRVRIDNVDEVVTFAGEPWGVPGFTSFTVRSPSGPRAFSFRGNDQGYEYLTLDLARPRAHRVDMGDGRNELSVTVGRPLAEDTSYRGGAGRDSLGLTLPGGEVAMDLGRRRLTTRVGATTGTARIVGFEAASATARVAHLVGTQRRDALWVAACRGRVVGLGGADDLGAMQPNRNLRCAPRSLTALGGPGKDRLTGSPGPDLLIGGAGPDSADGRGGRDTCEAESRHSCEKRL